MWTFRLFEDKDGRCPVKLYVDALNQAQQVSFFHRLKQYVAVTGPTTSSEILHKVEEFWQMSWGRHRVLMYIDQDQNFVLLHAFRKTTSKTKIRDINQARRNQKSDKERTTH